MSLMATATLLKFLMWELAEKSTYLPMLDQIFGGGGNNVVTIFDYEIKNLTSN